MTMWNDGPDFVHLLDDPYAPAIARRHICFGGGKGDSGGGQQQSQMQPTTSTVNQSNLPDYARPYFENIMNQAQSLGSAPYQAYTGDRIAPLTANQNAAISTVQNSQGAYQPFFNQAAQGLASVQNTAQNTSFDPQQATNSYNAQNFTPDQYTGANVAQYMNPYLQQSLDPQIQLLNRQFAQQGNQVNAQAAANGAFGGYRQGIEQSQNTLNNNLAFSNLVGQGYNNAFNQAAGQFNTSQQQAQQASALNNQNAQQQAGLGLQATGMNNQYGLAAGQLGLQAGQLGLQASQAQGALGTATQGAAQSDANALLNVGTVQQNQAQTGLNTAYQQYLDQRYAPYQQLNWESGILRGVPVTANQQVTGYTAPPSPVSQVAGLGLGAAGLAKMFS